MDWVTIYIIATILILPAFVFGFIAQNLAMSTFEHHAKTVAYKGITGRELAENLLAKAGISDVEVVNINGRMTDCYDPRNKVVKLSNATINSSSISALGVCAHEIGHAIQHHRKNIFFKIRQSIVPVVNIFSGMFIPLVFLGSILSFTFAIETVGYYIVLVSMITYGLTLLFYFVTLPLEYDASKKAIAMLEKENVLSPSELEHAKQVLKAAIYTYISSMMTTLLYFLRFLSYAMIFNKD